LRDDRARNIPEFPDDDVCPFAHSEAQRRQYAASKGRRLLRVGRPKGANMIGLLWFIA
jgi:hypothetical protein